MAKLGKKLKNAYSDVDVLNRYSIEEALNVLKKHCSKNFDETLDISMNLNIDPRKAEQNLRGVIQLPNGTGKTVKVAVFAKDDKAEAAKKAGADIVGSDDLAEKIQGGFTDFDRCIATPDMMITVGKLGKVLGPRGLMPNPKLGTVTTDVAEAVKAAKGGQLEYRTEKNGIIHAGIGKMSFDAKKLAENVLAFIDVIIKNKPSGVKGQYIKNISLSSTMGPGMKIDISAYKSA
ncbi:MAG: 50S ribosomal protein L1 [Rickettsiales bacterium]|nr:50S ribosomal protein L1 [Rickettsiales bacterium]|tara:strand:- start:70491 stop:71189 length:699 start_codon:yes stop_codon:yes gene_type:complete